MPTTAPLPPKRSRVSAKAKRAAAAADLAVAVLRVSTHEQGESGLGLEAQRDAIVAFAQREGLTLVGTFEDVTSGTVAPADRPGMTQALALLAAGSAGTLLTAKVDRLSRRNADLYALMDRSHREGWCIRTADEQLSTCGPNGRLMAGVAALFADLERGLIADRTKAALAVKKANGHRLGRPLATAPATRQRVRDLRGEGRTMQDIAVTLNTEGLLTATGRAWTWQNVRRVVNTLQLDDDAAGRRAHHVVHPRVETAPDGT